MARGGSLRSEVLTPELMEQLQTYHRQAADRGLPLATMALSWILAQKGVTSVLVGASSTKQLADNLKCVEVSAREEE